MYVCVVEAEFSQSILCAFQKFNSRAIAIKFKAIILKQNIKNNSITNQIQKNICNNAKL